jgi:hypothetical protein
MAIVSSSSSNTIKSIHSRYIHSCASRVVVVATSVLLSFSYKYFCICYDHDQQQKEECHRTDPDHNKYKDGSNGNNEKLDKFSSLPDELIHVPHSTSDNATSTDQSSTKQCFEKKIIGATKSFLLDWN